MLFSFFAPEHARQLQKLYEGPKWQEALAQGALKRAAQHMRTPPPVANVFALPVQQLLAINGARVQAFIRQGERNEEKLLSALGAWPERWPDGLPVQLSFLGLNLSFACDMQPKCLYCNQRPVAETMQLSDWQALIQSLPRTETGGVYVYFTGGEPLLWGEALWGPEGLIRLAGEAGAACNVNTNALALTPQAALGLVSAGTARVHISLDTHCPEIAAGIYQQPGRWTQVRRGLWNMQIAKALLGASHPIIHLNCVLTRQNAWSFPQFLHFVLQMKPLDEGSISPDLDVHLIPVGGPENRSLRLSAAEYVRFFTDTWAEAEKVWQEYQQARDIPSEQRKTLVGQMPFLSPYHRVQQRGELAEWAEYAAQGLPGALAISPRCYVAPTQSFVLPDGTQYWCGGHAISRPQPLGNVRERSVCENLRLGLRHWAALPIAECRTCPGATLAINQIVENRLRETLREWIKEAEGAAPENKAESDT